MERILNYTITSEYSEISVREFLYAVGFSSQNITDLKKMQKSLFVNHKWVYMNEKLTENDLVTIHIQENISSANIVPMELPFDIVYEDDDILVINKPSGMPIHPSQNHYENTLANAVAYYYNVQNIPFVFRCINRLDRDTTGVTVLAKHMLSASILGESVKNRTMKREYLALVDGTPEPLEGVVSAPIARKVGSTIEREVNFTMGETAVTHYKSLRTQNNISLLSLWLETGRTHQIRVHMKYISCPLLGDFLYHPNMNFIKRQALHSHRLAFLHPITKEPLTFEAPLPLDMCIFD